MARAHPPVSPRDGTAPSALFPPGTVLRVMGLETEYGITAPGHPRVNPMLTSSQIVTTYARHCYGDQRTRWDYEVESPLRDARNVDAATADSPRQPDGRVDATAVGDTDPGLANVLLPNGARLYVDHAHPEYATPEVTTPREALIWDHAGDLIVTDAARLVAATPGLLPLQLYKNNTDGKGASYGTHENYLLARGTPFADIVTHLTGFLITRQVFTGAGRVGLGQDGRRPGFQISQRADFFETEVGLETTLRRPIINTRDEPHADAERYRRLHVIIGDATLGQIATLLKVGTTSLMLSMIEAGWLRDPLIPAQPVRALHEVSHDPVLRQLIALRDGRQLTALELQEHYCTAALAFIEHHQGPQESAWDPDTREVIDLWRAVLGGLAHDISGEASRIDWVAKQALLEGYRGRDGLPWDHPTLALVDLQWADLRADRGLALLLAQRGARARCVSDDEIARAVTEPPATTRAWFRGMCLARFPESIAAASWDSLIFDLPGEPSLQRVATLEPLRGTRAHVAELFEGSATAAQLLAALRR